MSEPPISEPIILARPQPKSDTMPKIWAAVILILLGLAATLLILRVRPGIDPLAVIAITLPSITLAFGQFINFMKSEQTHNLVNSQLTEFKRVVVENARREGREQGGANERIRAAESAIPPITTDLPVVRAPVVVVEPTGPAKEKL